MERKDEKKAESAGSSRYTRKQLLGSEKYRYQRDFLSALLDDEKEYSIQEVDELIKTFMKGKVKVC